MQFDNLVSLFEIKPKLIPKLHAAKAIQNKQNKENETQQNMLNLKNLNWYSFIEI